MVDIKGNCNDTIIENGHLIPLENGSYLIKCNEDYFNQHSLVDYCNESITCIFANETINNDLIPRIQIPSFSIKGEGNSNENSILIGTVIGIIAMVTAFALFIWVRSTRRENVCWSHDTNVPELTNSEISISDNNRLDNQIKNTQLKNGENRLNGRTKSFKSFSTGRLESLREEDEHVVNETHSQ